MKSFFRKLKWLTQRRSKESELQEELQFHLDEEVEQRRDAGLTREDATWAARRDLGNVSLTKEDTRSAWGWTMLEQFGQDLRYAFRMMAANKSFSALAVLSLALGIGANTAIFSFMDMLLLRSLPVSQPESLAVLNWRMSASTIRGSVVHGGAGSIHSNDAKTVATSGIFPYPAFELLEKSSDSVFSSVFAYYPTRRVHLLVKGQGEQASGEYVSGDYFRGLDVLPAAGRVLIADDDRFGAAPATVLSFAFAQKRFGDAANAVDQRVFINNISFTVVGVASPEFFGVDPAHAPDFYVPVHSNVQLATLERASADNFLSRNYYWIEIMARLRPGINLQQAQAAMAPMFHQWVASTAANDAERERLPELWVREGADGLDTLRQRYSKPLYLLLAMVGLILAIACANLANLMLARSAARRREMAVRLSVGAGRFRVIRQLLTESVLLSSVGGAAGVLLAVWGVRFLSVLLANGNAEFRLRPDLNWHVLAAAIALSMITGLVFGLAPALQSTRVDVIPALRETRAGQPIGRRRFGRAGASQLLIVGQIALSLLMLVAAGLFIRTLENWRSIELGFNRDKLLLFQMNARQAGYKDPQVAAFYSDLLKRFAGIPGVHNVALSQHPLLGEGSWYTPAMPVGKQAAPGEPTHILMTSPNFLATMQIPLLAGREFDDRDRPNSAPVAIINQVFAKANFGEQNPLGQRIVLDMPASMKRAEIEIVGVSKNVRYGGLTEDFPPTVFLPFNQDLYYKDQGMTFALRTGGDPLRLASSVREIVHQADSRVPVTNIKTGSEQVDQEMNQEIVFAELCSALAILALVIACVGLYGTVSYSVARRTGEIGIRTALGAPRGRLVWMILRDVIVLAAVGLAISVPTALGTTKFVKSFLYAMKPNDPLSMTIAIVTLVAAVLLAGYVPARKASRIDPMTALRHE
jgi:macrolide transport system ATP-binding/permease protein